ncbi:hypothetical protein C8F04DRAFT_1190572 [Mycena alexandri]|uniref:Uncharacterized protein n=1 Tax=Mycena alexandri TaxID=1745969 RepID=A0AAD6SE94_9AGAR|nr:hypothetical protein C8F04DRAFT_1190572 [Mycena alexandri]
MYNDDDDGHPASGARSLAGVSNINPIFRCDPGAAPYLLARVHDPELGLRGRSPRRRDSEAQRCPWRQAAHTQSVIVEDLGRVAPFQGGAHAGRSYSFPSIYFNTVAHCINRRACAQAANPEFSALWQPGAATSKLQSDSTANIEAFDVDALGTIRQLAAFHKRCPVTPFEIFQCSVAFGYVAGFFDSIISALDALTGKVTLEFIHGELQHEFLRMFRIDYSNGPLGTALFVIPSLQDTNSTTGANHLLNFLAFLEKESSKFSNIYTHLKFKSYLGYPVVYMTPLDVIILYPLWPNPELVPAKNSKHGSSEDFVYADQRQEELDSESYSQH